MCTKIFISLFNVATFNFLIGCYSNNYITYNELRGYKGDNDVIITTTDSTEYILKRDSTIQYYSNWWYVDNNIEWTESKVIFLKDDPSFGKYTTINTTISENEILKIGIEELDVLNTVLLSIGIIVGAVLVIGALTFDLDFNLGSNN